MQEIVYYFLVLGAGLIVILLNQGSAKIRLLGRGEQLEVNFVIEGHFGAYDLEYSRAELNIGWFCCQLGQANTFKLSLLGLLLQEMDIGCLLVDLSFKHIGYLFDLILVVMDELLLL